MKRCETKLTEILCFIFIYIILQNTAKLHSNTLQAWSIPPAAAQSFCTTTSGVHSTAAWSPPSRCYNSRSTTQTGSATPIHVQTNKWEMGCQITLWLASWRRAWWTAARRTTGREVRGGGGRLEARGDCRSGGDRLDATSRQVATPATAWILAAEWQGASAGS
jgi:hypothetical protein